nr:MAG TPA: hypothetical protein [Bacteriophage sp.]
MAFGGASGLTGGVTPPQGPLGTPRRYANIPPRVSSNRGGYLTPRLPSLLKEEAW